MYPGVRSTSGVQWWQRQPLGRSLWAVPWPWPRLFCGTPGSGLFSSRPAGPRAAQAPPTASLTASAARVVSAAGRSWSGFTTVTVPSSHKDNSFPRACSPEQPLVPCQLYSHTLQASADPAGEDERHGITHEVPPGGTRSWSGGLPAAFTELLCLRGADTGPRPPLPMLWCHGFRSDRGSVISPEQKLAGRDIQGPGFQRCLWPRTLPFGDEGGVSPRSSGSWSCICRRLRSSAGLRPQLTPAAAPFHVSAGPLRTCSHTSRPTDLFCLGGALPPAPSLRVYFPALGVLLAEGCPDQTGGHGGSALTAEEQDPSETWGEKRTEGQT